MLADSPASSGGCATARLAAVIGPGYAGSMTALLWAVAIALILLGVAGTVLPALPGATLVFGGIVLAAWIDGFARIPVWVIVILGLMTAVTWVVDYAAAALGAKRAGASKLALFGAVAGTVAGVFSGLWGLLFMPLAGAAIGEYVAQRDLRRAGKVGLATWIGLLLGTAVKVAIVFAMIGIFVFALLLQRAPG
jgi:uncharacterized protein YqgC (DUF456 family)